MQKPDFCKSCVFAKHSTGFVGDLISLAPKLAVVLKMPGRDEIVKGEPMVGRTGRYWEEHFIHPLGLSRSDIIISNVLRCFPNGGEFPVRKLRKEAESTCRHWDSNLVEWKPNVIGISFNPAVLLRNPQQTKFLRRAFEKAKRLIDEGYRPLLLLGEEAKEVYAPHLWGGIKKWQGHFWKGTIHV